MPSSINAGQPADGAAVRKSDIRANFAVAKRELGHGGFFRGSLPGCVERRTADKLGEWVSVRDFGAKGDNDADDTAALQAALDAGGALWFPPGLYRITRTLSVPLSVSGGLRLHGGNWRTTAIVGAIADGPILTKGDWILRRDNTVTGGIGDSASDSWRIEGLGFVNNAPFGSCVMAVGLAAGACFLACGFDTRFRGVYSTNTQNLVFLACNFEGSFFVQHGSVGLQESLYGEAWGLALSGHNQAIGCNFKGCGTGLVAHGNSALAIGCRIETCGYGLRAGHPSMRLSDGQPEDGWAHRFHALGNSLESNVRNVFLDRGDGDLVDCHIHAGTNGPVQPDFPEYGIDVGNWTGKLRRCSASSSFTRFAARIPPGAALHEDCSWVNVHQGRPALTPKQQAWASAHVDQPSVGVPWNGAAVTVARNQVIAGIKGRRQPGGVLAFPKNLGGAVTVPAGATQVAVGFPIGRNSNDSGLALAAVADPSATLAPGLYCYANCWIDADGHEVGTEPGANNYREVEVAAGQRVEVTLLSTWGPGVRLYRGRIAASGNGVGGDWEGFWSLPGTAASFVDRGAVPFSERHEPLPITCNIPSRVEPDASYCVTATPSWGTTCWVTNKLRTGFTIRFGTAAPAGGSVQWLLFRP